MPSLARLAGEGIFHRSDIEWAEFFTPNLIMHEVASRHPGCC